VPLQLRYPNVTTRSRCKLCGIARQASVFLPGEIKRWRTTSALVERFVHDSARLLVAGMQPRWRLTAHGSGVRPQASGARNASLSHSLSGTTN